MDEKKFVEILENNNQKMFEVMDKRIEVNNQKIFDEMDKKLFESERRQNQKLAKMEHIYGDKINAIFDKIVCMEEILLDMKSQNDKFLNKFQEHDDLLFSHDFRISKLENQFNS